MSDLKAAGEFLESKGINLTNYAIFDTSGDFLQQIPIATWLNEFAEQQANKPTTSTEASIVNEPVLYLVPEVAEDEEKHPYCSDCGNDDLNYIDQYANGNYWECKDCKKKFIY